MRDAAGNAAGEGGRKGGKGGANAGSSSSSSGGGGQPRANCSCAPLAPPTHPSDAPPPPYQCNNRLCTRRAMFLKHGQPFLCDEDGATDAKGSEVCCPCSSQCRFSGLVRTDFFGLGGRLGGGLGGGGGLGSRGGGSGSFSFSHNRLDGLPDRLRFTAVLGQAVPASVKAQVCRRRVYRRRRVYVLSWEYSM